MLDTDNSTDLITDTGPGSDRPADSRAAAPKRIRVSALAKELGIISKQLLALLVELGEGAKTASSALNQEQADRARAAHAATSAAPATTPSAEPAPSKRRRTRSEPVAARDTAAAPPSTDVVFVAAGADQRTHAGTEQRSEPDAAPIAPRRRRRSAAAPAGPPPVVDVEPAGPDLAVVADAEDQTAEPEDVREAAEAEAFGAARKRRRRGRRGRGGGGGGGGGGQRGSDDTDDGAQDAQPPAESHGKQRAESQGHQRAESQGQQHAESQGHQRAESPPAATAEGTVEDPSGDDDGTEGDGTARRRRRRRRTTGGSSGDPETNTEDDPPNTVVHVRTPREAKAKDDADDGVKGVKGSTRLEARRQRRRDGRETNRRRPPILTESEFLARREAVDRVMAVRQSGDRTQIAVLEDNVLVEHYVTRASATSYVGNVYLGRVQNVLPSMEAAFVDIGKGRNGVLYAGEVNWDASGLEGKSRAIEQAMKSGDAVLVQVTKDPISHKGARLTSQVSLPGRFLVYVPSGGMTGISRRLPDNERHRLKAILKKIVPEDAGVIVRTAAEGASEQDLASDVERLQAEWASIKKKAAKTGSAPVLVHGEPDLAIRVVRDVFNEDFKKLIVQGEDAWQTVSDYIEGIAPDLGERASRHVGNSDLFHDLNVDEQLMKALDRKVWLPSGGSLVIDRTEAMTVIDVNTGKFVGSGGNLEQTVTRNNLEAAEEIVRQLRLRDVGGIVVIDFIDMVLESNRELVLRRLTECLGRDRTKHQVAEVTSLGLVQMTRKRVGEGLLEAFSETCEICHGRGVIIHSEPVDKGPTSAAGDADADATPSKTRRKRGGKAAVAETEEVDEDVDPAVSLERRTKALAAMSAIHRAAHPDALPSENTAQLELDAVQAVLAGSEQDGSEQDGSDQAGSDQAGFDQAGSDQAGFDQTGSDQAGESSASETPAAEPAPDHAEATEPERPPAIAHAEPAAEAPPEPAAAIRPEPVEPQLVEVAAAEDALEPVRHPRRRRSASRPAGPPLAG